MVLVGDGGEARGRGGGEEKGGGRESAEYSSTINSNTPFFSLCLFCDTAATAPSFSPYPRPLSIDFVSIKSPAKGWGGEKREGREVGDGGHSYLRRAESSFHPRADDAEDDAAGAFGV